MFIFFIFCPVSGNKNCRISEEMMVLSWQLALWCDGIHMWYPQISRLSGIMTDGRQTLQILEALSSVFKNVSFLYVFSGENLLNCLKIWNYTYPFPPRGLYDLWIAKQSGIDAYRVRQHAPARTPRCLDWSVTSLKTFQNAAWVEFLCLVLPPTRKCHKKRQVLLFFFSVCFSFGGHQRQWSLHSHLFPLVEQQSVLVEWWLGEMTFATGAFRGTCDVIVFRTVQRSLVKRESGQQKRANELSSLLVWSTKRCWGHSRVSS